MCGTYGTCRTQLTQPDSCRAHLVCVARRLVVVREGDEPGHHAHDGEGLNLQVADARVALALVHGNERHTLLVHVQVLDQACAQDKQTSSRRMSSG